MLRWLLLPLWGSGSMLCAADLQSVAIPYPISASQYPVVLYGAAVPGLIDAPIGAIALYAMHEDGFAPVTWQIDRRDNQGQLIIEAAAPDDARLDANDELVLMADAPGARATPPTRLGHRRALEIELVDPVNGARGFVYALVFDAARQVTRTALLDYDGAADAISTPTYRVAFSSHTPMLVEALQWSDPEVGGYAANFIDGMHIRHTGKFLHAFEFTRSEADYHSELVGVKAGPVRVIRRTANRVNIVWQLRSPTIRVDYIAYRDSFMMDILVDIPFRIGWFFSDVVTRTSLDGNADPRVPPFTLYAEGVGASRVDGRPDRVDAGFNAAGGDFVMANTDGNICVSLRTDHDAPIRARRYLVDDLALPDPPETIAGQFGNVGFSLTGWERLESRLYHVIYQVYMLRDPSIANGLHVLRQAPDTAFAAAPADVTESDTLH
jgi:hypothetical protein